MNSVWAPFRTQTYVFCAFGESWSFRSTWDQSSFCSGHCGRWCFCFSKPSAQPGSSTLHGTPAHWGCEALQWVVRHAAAPCMYIPSALLLLLLLALCSAMVLPGMLDFPGVMLAPPPWTHGLFDLRALPHNMNLWVE